MSTEHASRVLQKGNYVVNVNCGLSLMFIYVYVYST